MIPLVRDNEMSARRSRIRVQVLQAVVALGEAYASQIARFTGIRRDRVVGALIGDDRDFAKDLSPLRLGFVMRRRTKRGWAYGATQAGIAEAARLTAMLRDEANRAALEADLARARWSRLSGSVALPAPSAPQPTPNGPHTPPPPGPTGSDPGRGDPGALGP